MAKAAEDYNVAKIQAKLDALRKRAALNPRFGVKLPPKKDAKKASKPKQQALPFSSEAERAEFEAWRKQKKER